MIFKRDPKEEVSEFSHTPFVERPNLYSKFLSAQYGPHQYQLYDDILCENANGGLEVGRIFGFQYQVSTINSRFNKKNKTKQKQQQQQPLKFNRSTQIAILSKWWHPCTSICRKVRAENSKSILTSACKFLCGFFLFFFFSPFFFSKPSGERE